jgi:hypothetical protein
VVPNQSIGFTYQQDIRFNLRIVEPFDPVKLGWQRHDKDANPGLIDFVRDLGFLRRMPRRVKCRRKLLLYRLISRRQLLAAASAGGLALSKPAWAEKIIDLPLPGGPGARETTTAFPQKGPMILQRTVHRFWKHRLRFSTRVYSPPTISSTFAGTGRLSRPKLISTSSL